MTVNGTVLDGFEAVRYAFGQAQADDEGAAQLAVYHQGQLMVDLWTGQNVIGGRPYTGVGDSAKCCPGPRRSGLGPPTHQLACSLYEMEGR